MAGARKAIYPHVNPVTAPLSEDLWFMIFEIIQKHVELYRMKHYVLPLILVCKTWKRIATPLMYRSTHFASPARLKLFAQHLADGHWRPDAPGPCVRNLSVHHGGEPSRSDTLTIISLTPNLLSFSALSSIYQEIVMLASTSAQSLRDLSIVVLKVDDLASVLRALQHLKQLRRLEYTQYDLPNDFGAERIEMVDRLELPHLNELKLDVRERMPDAVRAFFFRGRYRSLRHLVLSYLEPYDTGALRRFLLSHGPLLTRIDFYFQASDLDLHEIPMERLPNLKAVGFEDESGDFPDETWHFKLPPSVQHFHILEWNIEEVQPYVEYFEALISAKYSVPFKFMHLDSRFSWSDILDDCPEDAGYWVRCARRLKEIKGIALLDRDGLQWTLEPVSE